MNAPRSAIAESELPGLRAALRIAETYLPDNDAIRFLRNDIKDRILKAESVASQSRPMEAERAGAQGCAGSHPAAEPQSPRPAGSTPAASSPSSTRPIRTAKQLYESNAASGAALIKGSPKHSEDMPRPDAAREYVFDAPKRLEELARVVDQDRSKGDYHRGRSDAAIIVREMAKTYAKEQAASSRISGERS